MADSNGLPPSGPSKTTKSDINLLYRATPLLKLSKHMHKAMSETCDQGPGNSAAGTQVVQLSEVKSNERHFIATKKSLESDNAVLQQKIDREMEGHQALENELELLKYQNSIQEFQIEQLMFELKCLKANDLLIARESSFKGFSNEDPTTPTPPSALKPKATSPRRHRFL